MANGTNVGAIYYTVEADTSRLLEAVNKSEKAVKDNAKAVSKMDGVVKKSTVQTDKQAEVVKKAAEAYKKLTLDTVRASDGMDRLGVAANDAKFKMNEVTKAIRGMGNESKATNEVMGSLRTILVGYMSISAAKGLIGMAETYRDMANQIRDLTASTAEYEDTQRRLLAVANDTGRTLDGVQADFVKVAQRITETGYSSNQALSAVEALNYQLANNGASAQQVSRAFTILSRVSVEGRVNFRRWEEISQAIPNLANMIADSMGIAADEVRKLGLAGKLTAKQFTDSFIQSLDDAREASGTASYSIADAYQKIQNNIASFVGEVNESAGSTRLMISALDLLAEHVDTLATVLTIAGMGALARYTVKLVAAAAAQARSGVEAYKKASKSLAAARADEQAARAAAIAATANRGLGGSHDAAAAATARHTVATNAARGAMITATSAARGLMMALGGPMGIATVALTAGASMLLFRDNTNEASYAVDLMAMSVNDLRRVTQSKNDDVARGMLLDLEKNAESSRDEIGKLVEEIAYLELLTDMRSKGFRGVANDAEDRLVDRRRKLALENEQLAENAKRQDVINQRLKEGIKLNKEGGKAQSEGFAEALQARRDRKELARVEGVEAEKLAIQQHYRDQFSKEEIKQLQDLADEEYGIRQKLAAQRDDAAGASRALEYVNQLERQNELLKLQGETQVRLKVAQDLAGADPETIARAQDLAVSIYNQQQATKGLAGSKSELADTTKDAAQAERELEQAGLDNLRALNSVVERIEDFKGLTRDQFIARAAKELNEFATPEQVARFKELNGELWDMQRVASHKEMLDNIDPLLRIKRQYGQELELLDEMLEMKTIKEDEYLHYREQREREYHDNIAELSERQFREHSEWNELLMSNMEAIASGTSNAISGLVTGMTDAKEAAQQVATAIVNDVVNSLVQMGLEWVKSMVVAKSAQASVAASSAVLGATTASAWSPAAAMVSLATMGANAAGAQAGIVATTGIAKAMSVSGGRQYGGGVNAGSMYRVNEDGAPEILNMANGRQYMIPNQRGEVVSNKDASAGGSTNIIVNITNNTSASVSASRRDENSGNKDAIIDIIIDDLARDGRASGAIRDRFGLTTQGR